MTITFLTIRQFLRSRSIFVVIGISFIAALFASITRFVPEDFTNRALREIFASNIYLGLISATLLPLSTLVLATGALGDEVEDRTLQYLALKPISRFSIVVQKFLAVVLVAVPVAWLGIAASWVLVAWGRFDALQELLLPALLSSLVCIFGFGALFLAFSLVIQRALLIGVFYVFVWESALSRFLPGIRSISIRHYTQSYFVRALDDRRIADLSGVSAESTIVWTVAGIVIVSLALGTWRLRVMSIE